MAALRTTLLVLTAITAGALSSCATPLVPDRQLGVWHHCPDLGEFADLPVCAGKMTLSSLVIYPVDGSAVATLAEHNRGASPKWRPLAGGMVQVLGPGDFWLDSTDPRELPHAPDTVLWAAARSNLNRLAGHARIEANSLGVLQVKLDVPDWKGLVPIDMATLALSDTLWRRPELAAFKGLPAFGFGGGRGDFLIADSADPTAMARMRKELEDLISLHSYEEGTAEWKRSGRLIHHSPAGVVFVRNTGGTWAVMGQR